jgi:hypothetical protein
LEAGAAKAPLVEALKQLANDASNDVNLDWFPPAQTYPPEK